MAIAKIEPTGCGEFHGNVKVRLAFYLEPEDARYDERHYLVPVIPESGYPGKVDDEGVPIDQADYDAWLESLPKKWVLAPFHNHFLYLSPDVTEDIIVAKANLHLPNFYAAWLQELDKINGGMRKGWAVETRKRPIGYDKTDPELYKLRQPQCLQKVELIKKLPLVIRSDKKGEIFPSTEITIGAAATDRSSYAVLGTTRVGKENSANDDGTIDEVEMWLTNEHEDVEVATFIDEGSNVLSTRDTEALGTIAGGSKQTSSALDMDVVTGDYLGIYGTYIFLKGIENDNSGDGAWYKTGDQIPSSSVTFSWAADKTISLYGTGETAGGVETSKTAAISIGTAMSATKILAAPRTASISIGDAVTATRVATWARTASIPTGISMSATRLLGATRLASITTGIAVTASKLYGWAKTAAITIGTAMSASRVATWGRTSSISIGDAVTATKILAAQRTSQITTGMAVTASRIYGRVRTATLTIGTVITASRVFGVIRTASITIGTAITATRVLAATRTASITTGIAVTATKILAAIRTATITIGIAITVDWWTRVVALTLRVRSMALTLQHRAFALSLPVRSFALTLQHRVFALTLRARSFSLTLPWRKTR